MRKLSIVAMLVFAFGCDQTKDKFDDVEPVTAPAKSAVSDESQTGAQADEMPSGHPPVGLDSPVPAPQTVEYGSPAEYGTTGPLHWKAPEAWQASRPGSSMRLAEYIVPGSPEAGVLSIFYFGASGGGGVDANVKRWVGQFDGGNAKPSTGQKAVNGMTVHTVDVSGTYNPGMAGGGAPPKDGYRMLGAIVESPAGLFFFKLVGPKAVIREHEAAWEGFVSSFERG